MVIEEGEEVEAKGMCNIFNKIITKQLPKSRETMPILVQKTSKTPNRLDKIEVPHNILSLKQVQRIEKEY
jgi:hypothetical protein